MQLVSNDSCKEDISESEPILSHSNISQHSGEESPSSLEIKSLGGDCEIHVDDLESIQIDETCHLVNPDQPQCRICLDNEGEDLIAPCHCKGTQKYVHRSCLDNWRSTKVNVRFSLASMFPHLQSDERGTLRLGKIEGFAFAHCTECRAMFVLRANVPADRWWLRLKFQFLVARDHAFIFVVVQLWSLVLNVSAAMEIEIFVGVKPGRCMEGKYELIVAFLGVLVYKFYGVELREMFGYGEHPYGFYTMAVLAIVLVGLLYGFFIAIICGQRINERHYHVLAKQELTKEYVVEDREASKDVPELGASHVSELRMSCYPVPGVDLRPGRVIPANGAWPCRGKGTSLGACGESTLLERANMMLHAAVSNKDDTDRAG
ncbi:hypothetical protein POTOM_037125 [Populus tomentosa]|uniref:RING-CH-type domain-containing protein n=1 Tax=Populus tomentosa TaxID=118781 RepID=A0A8X7Z3M8_POPTO|nr:hypothetical protein POTOM_037125 [Populus tomentosa]